MSAVYPEVGMHFWLTGSTRLTASASYWLTSEGRNHDFLFYGVGPPSTKTKNCCRIVRVVRGESHSWLSTAGTSEFI